MNWTRWARMGLCVCAYLASSAFVAKAAAAETWQARNLLMEDKSSGECLAYKDGGVYTLDYTNGVFTATYVNGKMFSVKLPADGTVSQPFRSPNGARLLIEGNAKTRDLTLVNSRAGCRWKMTPE